MDDIEGQQPEGPGLTESVWRYRKPVVAVAIVFTVIGFGYASGTKKTYTATAHIGLADPPRIQNVTTELGRYTSGAASFAVTSEVLDAAAAALHESSGQLSANATSASSATANVISLPAKGSTAQQAQARVDAVAKAFGEGMKKDASTRGQEQLKAIDKGIADAKALIRSGNGPLVTAGSQTLTQLLQQRAGIESELGRFGNGVR